MERLRLVSSGTEAAMSALRLARGATGRNGCIKFRGCYHGHADSFLIEAGSGALTFGNPSSPGVTPGAAGDTLLADYNDLDSVKALFEAHSGEVACVILEPVGGNMGVVPPADGFLQGLRALCTEHGALLIFDEVITGFRVGFGGAAQRFGVTPDLTILGKIIGGGMPVGAYGGAKAIMDEMAPVGPVYQAGTLSGNPIATAAGIATLTVLKEEDPYPELERLAARLESGTAENLAKFGGSWAQNRVASMSTLFFGVERATTYGDVQGADTETFARYHAGMLAAGIYLAPSQFEATFVSTAHTEADIDTLLEAQRTVLASMNS
jgi:glutamate-1-semialdehyde 2,1-aminomutase